MRKVIPKLIVILIILIGLLIGLFVYDNTKISKGNVVEDDIESDISIEKIEKVVAVETSAKEEKTTPSTLVIYKTYYTKCEHYIQRYEDIDTSLINLPEKEFKEKMREWSIEKFSEREIELSRQEETFCNEHYKLKLDNNVIVIYKIDENGNESEYEETGITSDYLTNEDILKLSAGIVVYGKENLSNTIEDYE